MWDSFKNIIYLGIGFVVFYAFFIQDFPEYECVEYRQSNYDNSSDVLILTDTKIHLYHSGGVHKFNTLKSDKAHSKVMHKKVEGEKYISYLRSGGMYSYKLNKDDLTYYYRLGSREGQCIKIGFSNKFNYPSFESLNVTEYDY